MMEQPWCCSWHKALQKKNEYENGMQITTNIKVLKINIKHMPER
jgi:hypothetical protein